MIPRDGGGGAPRRVNVRAVRRRERNLAKAAPRPTPAQLSAARATGRAYGRATVRPKARAYSPPATTHSDVASAGPRAAERAQRYRESRPYYKAYKDVWRQSPGVRRSEATITQGKRLSLQGGENTPPATARRARALMTRGLRGYERETRRGPDVLAKEAYTRYGNELWRRAARSYPSGTRPKQVLDYGPERKRAAAWVYSDVPGVVHVAPETARQFMNPKGGRGASESLLLHEWAHTRQPEALKRRSKALTEGGAEALDRMLAKRLGVPYWQSPDPAYRRWARRARRKGKRYLTREQFR